MDWSGVSKAFSHHFFLVVFSLLVVFPLLIRNPG
jgi:hypothetical protein